MKQIEVGGQKLKGRVLEKDGKHYLLFRAQRELRALPIKQKEDGTWEADFSDFDKGVWSEEKPNAEGGTDCIVHVPTLKIGSKVHDVH